MSSQMLSTRIMKYLPKPLRVFLIVLIFIVALDACIALNRWWLEGGFQAYLRSLTLMLVGFTVFVILISQTKTELIGYVFLVIAIYFVCNYEIGGPSKYYLTPFDPIFNIGPAFINGSTWLGLSSIVYRKSMTICTSILAALIFATSRLER